MEPVTGTGQFSCKEPPDTLEPVCSAVWSNCIVIPNRVVFVKLFQIGVFVDSINKIRGCKTMEIWFPVAVKSTGMCGGLSVCFGCDGCKVKLESFRMSLQCKALKSAKQNFFRNLNTVDQKLFWKTVHLLTSNSSSIPVLLHDCGKASTSQEKADILSEFFKKCFNSSILPLTFADFDTLELLLP